MTEQGEAGNNPEANLGDSTKSKVDAHDLMRPSADKRWEVKGALGAAAITALVGGVVTIVVALINQPDSGPPSGQPSSTESTAVTNGIVTGVSTPPVQPTSAAATAPAATSPVPPAVHLAGAISQVAVNDPPQGLTVSGRADPGIRTVLVTVGPRKGNDKQFWAAETKVAADGTWRLEVETPPALSFPFSLNALFDASSVYEYDDGFANWGDPDALAPDVCVQTEGLACVRSVGPPATYESDGPSP